MLHSSFEVGKLKPIGDIDQDSLRLLMEQERPLLQPIIDKDCSSGTGKFSHQILFMKHSPKLFKNINFHFDMSQ